MLAELCLEPECRRGHGGLDDALNCGEVGDRAAAAGGGRDPAAPVGRRPDPAGLRCLELAVRGLVRGDQPGAAVYTFPYARGKGSAQMIPGWPYSFIVALEPGRTSWTLPLDAVRLGPADASTEVTAGQVRGVVARLTAAGHWREGDPDILVVLDAGYDLTRLAWLLLWPSVMIGRLRSDRVMYFPAPPLPDGPRLTGGRRPRDGVQAPLRRAGATGQPAVTAVADTTRYGTATAMAWPRLHQRLEHRGSLGRPRRRAARHRGHPHPARRSITCPASATRTRFGCGPPTLAPPKKK